MQSVFLIVPRTTVLITSCIFLALISIPGHADSCVGFAPAPTGQFPVASARFDVKDDSRGDRLDADADAREFTVDAYYPAAEPAQATLYAEGAQKDVLMSAWPLNENVAHKRCVYLSTSDKPASGSGTFPVIIFSHGLSWPTAAYRSMLIDLASHGYVVLGLTHTHASSLTYFESGRKVDMDMWPRISEEEERQKFLANYLPEWISDIQYVANLQKNSNWLGRQAFGELINPDGAIGLMGHSYGASAAARAMDGQSMKVAFLMEGRYRGPKVEDGFTPKGVLAHLIGNYNRLELEGNQYTPGEWPVYEYVINGAWHASFSDLVMLYKLNAAEDWKARHFNELEPERAIRITMTLAVAFFDAWVKGEGKDSVHLHPVSYAEAVGSPHIGGFPEVELSIDIQPGFHEPEVEQSNAVKQRH